MRDDDDIEPSDGEPSYCEPLVEALLAYDRSKSGEPIPAGFTSCVVTVDATPSSTLDWKEELQEIERLLRSGYKLLFDLDLGLFTTSYQPQSLVLAIDEFHKRLLAPNRQECVGVILHRQKAFSSIAAREERMELLDDLRLELPDSVPVYLLFDCEEITDPFTFVHTFALDRFSLFQLALRNSPFPLKTAIWQSGQSLTTGFIGLSLPKTEAQPPDIGLLLPRSDQAPTTQLEEAFRHLVDQKIAFRAISEELLTHEWEGLDKLIVVTSDLAPTTHRALDGFKAAGGIVSQLQSSSPWQKRPFEPFCPPAPEPYST